MASTLGKVQPFRYRGYVFDEETDLYYLRSRYYEPGMCRFINADILVKGNLFCYCHNVPSCTFDQDGFECEYCGEEHIPLRGKSGDNLQTIRSNGLHRNEKRRIPWCQFIEWAYQMYTEKWDYAPNDSGEGIWYGHVDCSGIHRLIVWWYYNKDTVKNLSLGSSTAGGIYDNSLYNKPFPSRNVPIGKGLITENTVLVPGMGLFREGYNSSHVLTKIHMAIYVGDFFPGYSNAVIEAVEGGVVIRSLEESEEINGPFTHCGYFKGVAY